MCLPRDQDGFRDNRLIRRRSLIYWYGVGNVTKRVRQFDSLLQEEPKRQSHYEPIKLGYHVKDILKKFETTNTLDYDVRHTERPIPAPRTQYFLPDLHEKEKRPESEPIVSVRDSKKKRYCVKHGCKTPECIRNVILSFQSLEKDLTKVSEDWTEKHKSETEVKLNYPGKDEESFPSMDLNSKKFQISSSCPPNFGRDHEPKELAEENDGCTEKQIEFHKPREDIRHPRMDLNSYKIKSSSQYSSTCKREDEFKELTEVKSSSCLPNIGRDHKSKESKADENGGCTEKHVEFHEPVKDEVSFPGMDLNSFKVPLSSLSPSHIFATNDNNKASIELSDGKYKAKRALVLELSFDSAEGENTEDEGYEELNDPVYKLWLPTAETPLVDTFDEFSSVLRMGSKTHEEEYEECNFFPGEIIDDRSVIVDSDEDACFIRESNRNRAIRRKSKVYDVNARHRLPWKESNELYQTLTRSLDETMVSEIMKQQNSYIDSDQNLTPTFMLSGSPIALEYYSAPKRILWQNTHAVMSSGCLSLMTKKEIQCQETIFEILSSEGSYVHSLTVLQNHFMKKLHRVIPSILDEVTYNRLFSKLVPIIESARSFLSDLINLWRKDFMLREICAVVDKHYNIFKDIYVNYFRSSESMIVYYRDEIEHNHNFREFLEYLCEDPLVEKLPLDSFLRLPLQRITRMPLLFKTVISRKEITAPDYKEYVGTLRAVEYLATVCSDEVYRMKKCEEMLRVCQELAFPPGRNFPLAESERRLVYRTTVRQYLKNKMSRKIRLELFLFDDIFIYAKKCKDKHLVVCDFCTRPSLMMDYCPKNDVTTFSMFCNSSGEKKQLMVIFDQKSVRLRWQATLSPQESPITDRQVVAIKKYHKKKCDELNLEIGTVLGILREADDVYQGKNLATGEVGWLPISCTAKVTSPTIKEYNLSLAIQHQRERSRSVFFDTNLADSNQEFDA